MDEWIVHLVQGIYVNAGSHAHVGDGYSEEFRVKVWCSPRLCTQLTAFSSLCLKPCHVSFAPGSSGRISVLLTLLS